MQNFSPLHSLIIIIVMVCALCSELGLEVGLALLTACLLLRGLLSLFLLLDRPTRHGHLHTLNEVGVLLEEGLNATAQQECVLVALLIQ